MLGLTALAWDLPGGLGVGLTLWVGAPSRSQGLSLSLTGP